jgi:hypothetical protein
MVNRSLATPLGDNLYSNQCNNSIRPVAVLVDTDASKRLRKRRAVSSPDDNTVVQLLGTQCGKTTDVSTPIILSLTAVNPSIPKETATHTDTCTDVSMALLL